MPARHLPASLELAMSHWTAVAHVRDCPVGSALEVVAGDRIVALFNVDGVLYATDGICPHQGGPLADGELAGCIVTCPWHGWQFDVRDGQHQLSPKIKQLTYPVRVEGEMILIDYAVGDHAQGPSGKRLD